MKVALVVPAATVTLAGTEAAVFELASETTTPEGAALVSVTVPVDEEPPVTLVGDTPTEVRLAGAFTVRMAVRMTKALVAVIVTEV